MSTNGERRTRRQKSFKKWKPNLDECGQPKDFQNYLSTRVLEHGSTACFEQVEAALQNAATKFGYTATRKILFSPSSRLQELRVQRRRARDHAESKRL
eukprot:3814234-Pyramimonas_sp.AAC.1